MSDEIKEKKPAAKKATATTKEAKPKVPAKEKAVKTKEQAEENAKKTTTTTKEKVVKKETAAAPKKVPVSAGLGVKKPVAKKTPSKGEDAKAGESERVVVIEETGSVVSEKAEPTIASSADKILEQKAPSASKADVKEPASPPPAQKSVPAEKKVSAAPSVDLSKYPANRLKTKYKTEIVSALQKDKGYANVMQVPRLDKIILNMRMGDIKDNAKSIQSAVKELEAIAGQKAVLARAKKSVANFKLREGQPVGAMVTLRGNRMYEFYDKLVSIALPRMRDFRGVSPKAFDGRGNYAMGVKEQIVFPEISYELVEKVRGFDVIIVTTAKSDDEAKALLTKMGMPFKN